MQHPLFPAMPHMGHGGDYNPDQWLDRPDILEQDIEYMKKSHVNCVSLGIFAWSVLEPKEGEYHFEWLEQTVERLYQNGIYTMLATPSGAIPIWLARKYPEVRRLGRNEVRDEPNGRHNHCYTSPIYRGKVYQLNKMLSERLGKHPGVIAWHISNEYGGECYCPLCVAAFRDWLRKKYGAIDKLNAAWWTTFWSRRYADFEEIDPPYVQGEHCVHGLTLDWKRFVTYQTNNFVLHEKEAIRAGGSELPVTINMMNAFDGLNYFKFKDTVDFTSWDAYPTWHGELDDASLACRTAFIHDWIRSIKREQPFVLMESTPSMTNWQRVSKLKRPGMHMLSSMQAVAHGADSVQYFQWRKGRGSFEKFHGAVVSHDCRSDTRVFKDVQSVGERLAGLDEICGSRVKAQAAVIFDTENRWAIDGAAGPRNCGKHYLETCVQHYRALWEMGIPTDVIDMECDLSGYKLVVAPMLYLLRGGIAEKLRRFVAQGGTLVGTYWSGVVDENDLCFLGDCPGEGLAALYGIRAEEIDALYDGEYNHMEACGHHLLKHERYKLTELCERIHPEGAKVLARYMEDFYAGEPALTVNRFGEGRAYYLAAKAGMKFYRDFYRSLAELAGMKAPLTAELPEGVVAAVRQGEGADYLFLQNWNAQPAGFEVEETLTDLETGRPVHGKLTLDAYGMLILRRER